MGRFTLPSDVNDQPDAKSSIQPQNSIATTSTGYKNIKEKTISKSSTGQSKVTDVDRKFEEQKTESQGMVGPSNVIGMRGGDEDLVDDSPGLMNTQELNIGKIDSD